MATITIPEQHWRPHQINPVLLRAHPIARGLKFAEVFHEGRGRYVYDRVKPLIYGDADLVYSSAWTQTELGTAMTVDDRVANNPVTWFSASNYYETLAEFSVEMIVRHNSTDEGAYYDISFGVNPIQLSGALSGGGICWNLDMHYSPGGRRVWSSPGNSVDLIPVPTVGTWYQYLFSKAGSACPVLYINGKDVSSTIAGVADHCVSSNITGGTIRMFGGLFGSKPWRTAISFRIWDRPLEASEIDQLYRDPWVIYEEATSFRRTIGRFFVNIPVQHIIGGAVVDGDNVSEGGGAVVADFQIVGASVVDGDAVASGPGGLIWEKGLLTGAGCVDGDAVGGNGLISIAAAPETEENIPSVDIGGSRDEVFVQVIVSNGAEFVIECSEDDQEFFAATPTLSANTFWHCDRIVPYWRVRKTNRLGTLLSYWGPQEGRVDGREKGVVSPRVRYSNQDTRKSH